MHEPIDLILGGVLILFYSGNRFNTPPTNRSSTTAVRYFVGLFFYCLVGIGSYILLVEFPHLLEFLAQGNAVPPWARELSNPLLVALSLTVLLPKLPVLSTMDHWICRQLQDMAAIPYEVRRLSAELRKGRLQISAGEQAATRQRLEGDGFDPKDIVFDPTREPANRWTRLAVLLHKLEDWESDRRMAGYLAEFHGQLENLRRRYEYLASKAKTCLRLLDESAAAGATGKTHEAVVRYEEDFTEQLGQLHQDVLDFIARGVLHAELTDTARLNRLRALGFLFEWERAVFTLNQMMLLFGVVCIAVLWGFVLFAGINRELPFGVLLTRAIMISVIYSVAVACAVLPKSKWKFAKAQPGGEKPIAFYLVAGLMAVMISQFISLTFNSILMHGIQGGWQRFQLTYPWLLITFGTALMTGILVDNPRFPHLSRWQQRCIEGLVQGAAMLGVAYLTHYWLQQRIEMVRAVPQNYSVPSLACVMGMSCVVGLVIGYFIPTWYREAPRRFPEMHEAERAEALPLSGSAAAQSSESMIST